MLKVQSLNGTWHFRESGKKKWLPAEVPGCVHTDLMEIDLIADPFIGDNERNIMWVAEKDWEYQLVFHPEERLLAQDRIFLVAEGLDTLAEVSLNGQTLGKANNQFRRWEWEIKDLLVGGANKLHVKFFGPTTYVTNKQRKRPLKGVDQAIKGGPHLRKAPCQFGWDWGPMLPSIGIWKDIQLEGRSVARFKDVHLRQDHTNGDVRILFDVEVEKWEDTELTLNIELESPDTKKKSIIEDLSNDEATLSYQVENPILWWPNGYGTQNLYKINVGLYQGSKKLDERNFNLGLRTVELLQEPDEYGRSFQFIVNEVPIFAKGSNWIPADTFITRFSDDRLEKLIVGAAASHQNMVRVWGGGLYEEERFYDLCDKHGILVWQDFVFSCSIYPLDREEFLKNVQVEVEENVKRLRHRACLALWCGNNEMEWGWESWGWQKHPLEDLLPDLVEEYPQLKLLLDSMDDRELLPDWKNLKDAYDHFFHQQLPNWVLELDPDTPYWPSSPSSNTPFREANGQRMGDAHYWDVWHGRKPFTAYRESYPRFMSEFGFQAFPSIETIHFYTEPEDRNLTSYIMEHHQRGNHGNGLMIAQMTDTFQMPADFYSWIYLSNVLQAEGIRYGVEHWRRNMHRVSGTLYWQLNDCWPVASWSSIDYFGRWKALHYAAKGFYAPLLLSIEDKPPVMDVHLTSDLTAAVSCNITWSLETIGGVKIKNGEIETTAKPLANTLVHSFDFGNIVHVDNKREVVFICELWKDGVLLATNIGTFAPNKHLSLQDPELKVSIKEQDEIFEIKCSTSQLARFVELKLKGYEVEFSDNYFDIPAGRTRTVVCKKPDGLSLGMANNRLRTFSLYDSFNSPSN